jgi:YrbI family 3-deoxy-D-manno-octulosonate 8-phosphate phosphatase
MEEKAAKIKLLCLDVDGVMTDGKITFVQGEEVKHFDTKDGVGLVLARMNGLKLGLISGRTSAAVMKRAKSLGMEEVHQGIIHKEPVLQKITRKYGLKNENICYMGDDLIDLGVLNAAGLSVAVADAVAEVRRNVDYVTRRAGGQGAVREVVELILKAQGKWGKTVKQYLEKR